MKIGVLPLGDPGVFRSLLLPEVAAALTDKEPITAFGLTQNDLAICAAAGYLEEDSFLILSFYIAPDYRRCGGGRLLMETLAEALRSEASHISLSFTAMEPEQETLLPFLDALGFLQEADHGETIYLTSIEKITDTPFFAAGEKTGGIPFSELTEQQLSAATKAAQLALAPMPQDGFRAKSVEQEISMAYIKEGALLAYIIFETTWEDGLILSALWSGAENLAVLPILLRTAAARVQKKYPPQTKLILQAVNPASAALIRHLLPEAKNISYTYHMSLESRLAERI